MSSVVAESKQRESTGGRMVLLGVALVGLMLVGGVVFLFVSREQTRDDERLRFLAAADALPIGGPVEVHEARIRDLEAMELHDPAMVTARESCVRAHRLMVRFDRTHSVAEPGTDAGLPEGADWVSIGITTIDPLLERCRADCHVVREAE